MDRWNRLSHWLTHCDSKAMQLKLNELLLALEAPDSNLVNAAHLGDEELQDLEDHHESQV